MLPLAASDPNWFYSTLAQSTAALVGLAGAFLVQRLLTQRADIGPARADIRLEALSLFRNRIASEREDARVVLESLQPAVEEAKKAVESGHLVRIDRTVYALDASSGPSGTSGLEAPHNGLAILEQARDVVSDYHEALAMLGWQEVAEYIRDPGEIGPADAAWLNDPETRPAGQESDPRHGLWARLEEQRYIAALRWRALRAESGNIGARVEVLRSRLAPRSFYMLFGLLGALLLAGVVAPLFFLSAESGPSKFILLLLFIPLAVTFVGFYGWELRQLRRADRFVDEGF